MFGDGGATTDVIRCCGGGRIMHSRLASQSLAGGLWCVRVGRPIGCRRRPGGAVPLLAGQRTSAWLAGGFAGIGEHDKVHS